MGVKPSAAHADLKGREAGESTFFNHKCDNVSVNVDTKCVL